MSIANRYNLRTMQLSRRDCMLAALCWAEVLPAQPEWKWFDPATAAEIGAIAGQIVPDDETPGAERVGVVYFIDRALAGFDQDRRSLYRAGLQEAQARRAQLFPASASIRELRPEQIVELLKSIETTEFFQQVRTHAVLGWLGHPMHGGNRGMAGWKAVGIQHAMQYQPPFGFYDGPAGKR